MAGFSVYGQCAVFKPRRRHHFIQDLVQYIADFGVLMLAFPVEFRDQIQCVGEGIEDLPQVSTHRHDTYFSNERSIQAVFSWACMRVVAKSAVGWSLASSARRNASRAVLAQIS